MIVNTHNSEHYKWGAGCDGWLLLPRTDLNVIFERMPAGAAETAHHHETARQFFFVTAGELTMKVSDTEHRLSRGDGIEIPPHASHQAMNRSTETAEFLVISHPTTRGDRINAEADERQVPS